MGSSRAQRPTGTREQTYSQTDSLGVSKEFARRDHTHGTPDLELWDVPPSDGYTYAYRNGRWVIVPIIDSLADIADLVALFSDWKDPTGWVDPSLITVTYNSGSDTITLTGTLDYYWRGIKKSLTSPWTSTAHPSGTGQNYYLFSSDGDTFGWSTSVWEFSDLQVAFIQHGVSDLFAIREVHGLMPYTAHSSFHNTIGTYKVSGGDVTGYTLSSTTATNRRPVISQTVVRDEDLQTTIPAHSSQLYTKCYLSGANTLNFTVETADIVPLSGNNPYWNQLTGGNWVQTLMLNSTYMSVWLVAVPTAADTDSQKYRYLWIQGQSNGTLASEQALFPNNLTLTALPAAFTEFIFLAKVIIRYIGANWTIEQVQILVGTQKAQLTLSGGGGGISEAPVDGKYYIRKDGAWEELVIS